MVSRPVEPPRECQMDQDVASKIVTHNRRFQDYYAESDIQFKTLFERLTQAELNPKI